MRRLVVLGALLFAAACQSAPATVSLAPAPKDNAVAYTLPPIPREVTSALGPIRVVWRDSLAFPDGTPLLGGFQVSERVIYLNTAVTNPLVAWQTLLHEKCHVAFFDSGLRSAIPGPLVEAICDALATARLADMIQKP
jgi:hypothetical protein